MNANRKVIIKSIVYQLYLLISQMAEIGEDYSLLMRQYNDMIEENGLPLKKIRWNGFNSFEEYEWR